MLDAVGANSVRRKVRGSNLAQPVVPFWSATTLEHVLEFKTSRRTRQQATYEIALGKRPSPVGSLVVMRCRLIGTPKTFPMREMACGPLLPGRADQRGVKTR